MEQESATYIKGFNDGYKLAKFQPELWAKLKPSLNNGVEYEKGILEGANQIEMEKGIEQNRLKDLDNIRGVKKQEQNLEK